MKSYRPIATLLMAAALSALLALPATAATGDTDGDQLPDEWELRHHLPIDEPSAGRDPDRDRLTNLEEYRLRSAPRNADTDSDGAEDGFEVAWKLKVRDADSNDDGELDGDEDSDRNGVDNEDQDDLVEPCAYDDGDRDGDDIDNEDENDFRMRTGDPDSDDDGIDDGEEDRDRDGRSNEDEDDRNRTDDCDSDSDDDGDDDEDDDDSLGAIVDYDAASQTLTVKTVNGVVLTLSVAGALEIEVDEECVAGWEGDDDPTLADLPAGTPIGEFEIDFRDGVIEELEIECED